MHATAQPWARYGTHRCVAEDLGIVLDATRVRFGEGYLDRLAPAMAAALRAMAALEGGALANPGERRMVGHYWLRAPELAPGPEVAGAIRAAVTAVNDFAARVRAGGVRGAGGPFAHVLHVGIGGSALGSQLVCEALADDASPLAVHFLDNADPDGVDRVLSGIGGALDRTLLSLVSKSGFTPTPNYVAAEVEAAYRRRGLDPARHAVATTVPGTDLDARAEREGWLARFPLWEWVGGRTSVTSAVGLLPLALLGADVDGFLTGAAAMDRLTREPELRRNPAALLAAAWHWLGDGHGARNMVVLPYRDRLALVPRYVQQLVMESIGKRLDRGGAEVRQGLTVYGNKGTSDQHAYLQQLKDGPDDHFVTFVGALSSRRGGAPDPEPEVEPGVTLGDVLFASILGTREALTERGRDSVTITMRDVDAVSVGALVALFERAVGIYAELIDVNAYDQPGVDKFVASPLLALQRRLLEHLRAASRPETAEAIAAAVAPKACVDTVYELLRRLSLDPRRGVVREPGASPEADRFRAGDAEPAGRSAVGTGSHAG
jgi:glucose-6-phosphate isomerase